MQEIHGLGKYGYQKVGLTIIPGLLLMSIALITIFFVVFSLNDTFSTFPYLFLLPWIFALGILMIIPSIVLYRQGKFSFADPLIFATWSYFFPAFVIGGLLLATGLSDPYYLTFVQDTDYFLPYTTFLMGLGYAGLAVGYFLPVGAFIGRYVDKFKPDREHDVSSYAFPGVFLLALGFLNSILALALGIIGYQKPDEMSIYDGLVYLTTLFFMQGGFLLCFIVFRQRKWNLVNISLMGLFIVASIIKVVFSGYRGAIIQIFVVVLLAFILAGRAFRLKQGFVAGAILIVCLIAGMIYGSTFRSVKGSESQVSLETYTDNVLTTFDQLGSNTNVGTLEFGMMRLVERIEALSSVAVVVSNYEQLAPYEESYGLDNNIWKDTTTFFIPRILWNDKPLASEPRRYGDLYFNYGENSFTITPIGDLLRNFGVPGVFLGMVLMGIILRTIYRCLIEDQQPVIWKVMLYFMLLTTVNYETFYGAFVPMLFKVGIVSIVGILMVYFVRNLIGSDSPLQSK